MASAAHAAAQRESASACCRRHFEFAADRLALAPLLRAQIAHPFREMRSVLSISSDDGRVRQFESFRVQHNGMRGPMLAPLTLRQGMTLDQARMHAELMTWKAAACGAPFGGACAAVNCDPRTLSESERDRLMREWTRRQSGISGHYTDVEVTSSLQQDEMTAVGIATLVRESAATADVATVGLRVAVQGTGDIAQQICQVLSNDPSVSLLRQRTDWIDQSSSVPTLSRVDILEAPCDVLILTEESVLNSNTAVAVRAKVVIEAVDAGCTLLGELVLLRLGIQVVPDVIAGAAQVAAIRTGWEELQMQKPASAHDRIAGVIRTVRTAYQSSCEWAQQGKMTLREAAYCMAIERLARAEKLRLS
jgi:glutamate dehydrogenase (NAD(P)+)